MTCSLLPKAKEILFQALKGNLNVDVNEAHELAFGVLLEHRRSYIVCRVTKFLQMLDTGANWQRKIRDTLLREHRFNETEYDNFMDSVSVPLRQSVQNTTGRISELCAERELDRSGLTPNKHYSRQARGGRIDLIVYYPDIDTAKTEHQIEIKSMTLRERAEQGLLARGGSLFAFFNDSDEFTKTKLERLSETCKKKGGHVYIPPMTLEGVRKRIKDKGWDSSFSHELRSNARFGSDMEQLVKTGKVP